MTNEQRIKRAADAVSKSLTKLSKTDPEMAARMTKALADEMQRMREGR